MRKHGLSKSEVYSNIQKLRQTDVPWDRVLNSICTQPHEVAVKAFTDAIDTNLGDVRIFQGTHQIEQQVIQSISTFLHAKEPAGSLVSGGTEANLLALYVAKKQARSKAKNRHVSEVICAETVHYSMKKIFDLLDLTAVILPVDEKFRMDISQINKHISENTVAIVATAGSSEFGSIDPIEELSDIAVAHQIYLHVDAATGGFIIPFAKALGYQLPNFDFSLPGVSSITMDPHKYGLANIPAGGIFFRDQSLIELISLDSFFINTPSHKTFLGTRPGGAAVATFAVLEHLGWDGYKEITRKNYATMEYLVEQLKWRNYQLASPPELNIVIVDLPNAEEVMTLLEEWDWIISVSKRFRHCLRLVITAHVNIEMIDNFLTVLDGAVNCLSDTASLENTQASHGAKG
ncbi:tyrosine decarboxylase MfnA [Shewanella woodyi]|uniref:Pyridoxal-dependent decarboxylase n=1 Tax=Shewanella woodyi (strain ATCC 51908 / MS32) TaxID=392500 RepID=B1KQQ2_SHEWM|nr:tyrosine decarboxylase MfnA [Shewanella woodyi]ACA86291.1 Pyridoxal-dependent decarboxylase [Shewanella woodyi ATCC 51908]